MENQEMNVTPETESKNIETLKIQFSRKLARLFTSKSGKDMVAIKIPNEDPDDKNNCTHRDSAQARTGHGACRKHPSRQLLG